MPNGLPELDESFFQQAGQQFQQAAASALPSQQDITTASDRLTSRLASAQASQQRQAQNQAAGLGRSRSGEAARRQGDIRGQTLGALGTGLADIQEDFNRRRQEGAGILSNIGQGLTGLGTAQTQGRVGLGTLGVEQQQANTLQQQVANQLELGRGQLGVSQQEADTGAQSVANQLQIAQEQNEIERLRQAFEQSFGEGRLGLEQAALDETQAQNDFRNILDSLATQGTIGAIAATPELPPEFVGQFNALLEQLFAQTGTNFPGGIPASTEG